VEGGQFRYIYFLDKRWRKRLTVAPQSYPKQSDIRYCVNIKKENYSKEDLWDEFQALLHRD